MNPHTQWQTVQMQISWLLQKPTDLALHRSQMQNISGTSRTRVKENKNLIKENILHINAKYEDKPTDATLCFNNPYKPDTGAFIQQLSVMQPGKKSLMVCTNSKVLISLYTPNLFVR